MLPRPSLSLERARTVGFRIDHFIHQCPLLMFTNRCRGLGVEHRAKIGSKSSYYSQTPKLLRVTSVTYLKLSLYFKGFAKCLLTKPQRNKAGTCLFLACFCNIIDCLNLEININIFSANIYIVVTFFSAKHWIDIITAK